MTKNVARIDRRASSGTPVVIWLPWESSKLSSTGFGGSGAPVVRWARCSSGEIVEYPPACRASSWARKAAGGQISVARAEAESPARQSRSWCQHRTGTSAARARTCAARCGEVDGGRGRGGGDGGGGDAGAAGAGAEVPQPAAARRRRPAAPSRTVRRLTPWGNPRRSPRDPGPRHGDIRVGRRVVPGPPPSRGVQDDVMSSRHDDITEPGPPRLEEVSDGIHAYVQPDGTWWINNTGVRRRAAGGRQRSTPAPPSGGPARSSTPSRRSAPPRCAP